MDDIDLFIGAMSERPAKGALVSQTFQEIIADQFQKLKRGDRFFYDLAGQPSSFTAGITYLKQWQLYLHLFHCFRFWSVEQLQQIRQTSFARLVCDNSHVESTQPLVFKFASPMLV